MSTINVSSGLIGAFTWANAGAATWEDPVLGSRSWENAYATINITLGIEEDVLSVGEVAGPAGGYAIDTQRSVAFAESFAKTMTQEFDEALGFVDPFATSASFSRNLAESMGLVDSLATAAEFRLAPEETLGLTELGAREAGAHFAESLAVSENFGRVVAFLLARSESLSVGEALGKVYGLQKAELLRVLDKIRRQGDFVISDIAVSSNELTLAAFEELLSSGTAAGHEPWRDFNPGDYEYRHAMFRLILEATTQDRGLISGLSSSVDVPDVNDRGSATVVNATAGVVVTFNRPFHVVPEVTMSSKGGAGGNPIVPEYLALPTRFGFTTRLRDTITGSYVTGSLTWNASGY